MTERFPQIIAASVLLLFTTGCRESVQTKGGSDSIAEAWQKYRFGAYDAAIASFQDIANHSPKGSDKRLEALYGMGTVWALRRPGEEPKRARELYREVIDLNPTGEFAAWSQLALARMDELVPVDQKPDRRAVWAAYQQVIDLHPNQIPAEEALIFQQVGLVESCKVDDARTALAALQEFVSTHPASYYLSAAHGMMADCYHVLGEPEKRLAEEIVSLDIREKAARDAWKKTRSSEFLFNDTTTFKIANIAEFEAGDFDTARKYYARFLKENPTEKRCFYATQAIARMNRVEAEIRAQLKSSGS